jgi:hypothetical protein
MNKTGIIAILGGLILFAVGTLFHFLKLPDSFHGMIVGPALIVIGVIIFLLKTVKHQPPHRTMTRLSSKTTIIFKYILPVLGVIALYVFYQFVAKENSRLNPILLFMFSMWIASTVISALISDVFYDNSGVSFRRYYRNIFVPFNEIKSIDQFAFNFYLIRTNAGRKFIFIPSVEDFFANRFHELETIKEFKIKAGLPTKTL